MKSSSKSSTPLSKKRKNRRLLRVGVAIVVIILAVRLILPYWILGYVNKSLANINGYFGHVDDIDLSLYRGAYQVDSIYINKLDTTNQKQTPFFSSPRTEISIEWKSLLKGEIVSELDLYSPDLRFTAGKSEPDQLEKDTNDFRTMLKTFTPLKVNRVEVFDGTIQFVDNTSSPKVDIQLDNAHILAKNLHNVVDTALLPANVKATANLYGGTMSFNMRINALADHPTYDMNAEVKNANLVGVNDFLKAYANFDVNKGTLGLYMEIAAKDRKFIGYVKPVIEDLDVVGPEDRKDSVFRKLWEGLVGIAGDLVTNPKTDQIATKIPLVGEYGESRVGTWYAIGSALRNAFIQAIYPTLDNQVSINTVSAIDRKDGNKEGLFKKIFPKSGTKKDNKKDK